ncbi:type II toxin-antitoxin system VapC family toxin [Nocardia pseudobrasiliensis]|uniref:Ribonuclease VapC n=1 Tax=Nocardia pseudobrasiliensis TaxID=45979 RepID=A0A370ICI6_9NOCA|nr:type II toxin-antitoxin system VapC family toxin [Nocardia pseudobrasiliensis]RDI67114.1 putative nucleic acid-binding protein [Nocardia pseudobrasiliensis]
MSDEYVVDASAVSAALVRKDAVGVAVGRLLESSVTHAPHLIDAEVGQVLRRHEYQGRIGEEVAAVGLRMMTALVDNRYEHQGWMATEAWKLRRTISFYDALYVALATRLDIPLLTSDEKLGKASGLSCRVELLG